jgi:hypothetical protein
MSSGKRLSEKTTAGKTGIRQELSAITLGRKVPLPAAAAVIAQDAENAGL